MASDSNDRISDTRYGWWSELDIAVRKRVVVYYRKQTYEQRKNNLQKIEIRITGVTSTKKGIGYKWADCQFIGELEPEFVREEAFSSLPPA